MDYCPLRLGRRTLACSLLSTLLFYVLFSTTAAISGTEDQLITSLLSTYNQFARPAVETVNVSVDFLVASIDGMDERTETFYATVQLTATWYDKRLQWNPSNWSGIDTISLPASAIWVPDLALVNSAGDIYNKAFYTSYYLVEVSYLGELVWATYGPIEAKCQLNLWAFPFDYQMCYFHYESWVYRSYLSRLIPSNFTVDMVTDSGEWHASKASSLGALSNDDPIYSYSDIYFCLTLQRKTQFFLLRYIFPTASLSALVSLVFFLPDESGEKIALDITLLLSFFFLFVDVSSILPVTSDYVPLLSKYLVFVIIISGISLVCTTIVIRISHSGAAEVPSWVERIIIKKLGLWFRIVSGNKETEKKTKSAVSVAPRLEESWDDKQTAMGALAEHPVNDGDTKTTYGDPTIRDILTTVKAIEREHMHNRERQERHETWVIVGMVFDRIFFLLYTVATILVSIVLLLIMPLQMGSDTECSPCDCYNGFVY